MTNEIQNDNDDQHNFAVFAPSQDPFSFDEAVKDVKWRKAMDLEIEAIERNGT